MENKFTKNQIILLIVIFLLVSGVVYTIYDQKNKVGEVAIPEETTKVDQSSEAKPDNSSVNTEQSESTVKLVVPKQNEDFNKAMHNAQVAFGDGKYDQAITSYKEALSFIKSEKAYAGLYTVYSAKNDWNNAIKSLDKAIELAPYYPDYWKWKMTYLDDKTKSSYADIEKFYNTAITKVDPRAKIDLTTHLARIAESNGMKEEAVNAWQKAIELYPANKAIYQAEINRLKAE